ncbi:MAG: hypothetical protein QOH41_703 [Blastocatellia bacterium]|jgi:ornithine cyclodeaminase|nr:hypothetical protein [Blastocatellia bacterium]
MAKDGILILKGREVNALLANRELELIRIVQSAYEAHAQGESSLPHSTFLRFPADAGNRIIALPAYLGNGSGIAGLKWVSSFPGNRARGIDRASAVVILNSATTGRPEAILEGSVISAKRTAASAALAAQVLQSGQRSDSAGLVGCGVINYEIARFLLVACPSIKTLVVYDKLKERADRFKEKCAELVTGLQVVVAEDLSTLLRRSSLVSFATTAIEPHVSDLSACAPGSTILHISLRDLTPEVILAGDNIVDDLDHVSRAQTSIHLTEQFIGNRDFVRGTLSDITLGRIPGRKDRHTLAIFSPFGLGILDLAVSKFVCEQARQQGLGTIIESFLPEPWAFDPVEAIAADKAEDAKIMSREERRPNDLQTNGQA